MSESAPLPQPNIRVRSLKPVIGLTLTVPAVVDRLDSAEACNHTNTSRVGRCGRCSALTGGQEIVSHGTTWADEARLSLHGLTPLVLPHPRGIDHEVDLGRAPRMGLGGVRL